MERTSMKKLGKTDQRLARAKEQKSEEDFKLLQAAHCKDILALCLLSGEGPTGYYRSQYGYFQQQQAIAQDKISMLNCSINAVEAAKVSAFNRELAYQTAKDIKQYSDSRKKDKKLLKTVVRQSRNHEQNVFPMVKDALRSMVTFDEEESNIDNDELEKHMEGISARMLEKAIDARVHDSDLGSCTDEDRHTSTVKKME